MTKTDDRAREIERECGGMARANSVERDRRPAKARAVARVDAHTDEPPGRLAPHRQEVGAALDLFGARVLAAMAFKDGRLRLLFDGGDQLHVPPDSFYEAWSLSGPGTLRAVCLPRGGLAIWA